MKNLFKILALLLLGAMTSYFNLSYAGCNPDATVSNIINGAGGKACPTALSNAGLSASMLAIVGRCPGDPQITAACNTFTGAQLSQCQAFYMQAYYGKVQAACHYLSNVQSANASYTAPPPKPRS